MKKIIAVLIVIVLLFTPLNLSARGSKIYINSSEETFSTETYFNENIDRYLIAESVVYDYSLEKFTIGEAFVPFSIDEDHVKAHYYPIYYDGQLKYTFRVFMTDSGEYNGVLSGMLVKELSEVIDEAISESTFVIDNGNVLLYNKNGKKLVYRSMSGTSSTYPEIDVKSGVKVDIISVQELTTPMVEQSSMGMLSMLSYNYLSTDFLEKQGEDDWCSAYSTANILRYIEGVGTSTYSAEQIMEYYFPYTNPIDLRDKALSISNAEDYMHVSGYTNATKKYLEILSQTQVNIEINGDRPNYIVVDMVGGTRSHAMVLRGFNDFSSVYSYWNPWYDFYESVSSSDFTVNLNGNNYEWKHYISNIS